MAQYIMVKEGDMLQKVAAVFLGDATLWVYIARANGLLDAKVKGMRKLLIPDVSRDLTGGLLQ